MTVVHIPYKIIDELAECCDKIQTVEANGDQWEHLKARIREIGQEAYDIGEGANIGGLDLMEIYHQKISAHRWILEETIMEILNDCWDNIGDQFKRVNYRSRKYY
jgi:hypothetical protein